MTPLLASVWLLLCICFNDEILIPSSLSSIISKCVNQSQAHCVIILIIVLRDPTYFFCSNSVREDVDILAT